MFSVNVAREVRLISEKFRIKEGAPVLAEAIGEVMLGILHPNFLIRTLAERADISTDQAQKIALDVSTKIFAPVRQELLAMYRGQTPQLTITDRQPAASGAQAARPSTPTATPPRLLHSTTGNVQPKTFGGPQGPPQPPTTPPVTKPSLPPPPAAQAFTSSLPPPPFMAKPAPTPAPPLFQAPFAPKVVDIPKPPLSPIGPPQTTQPPTPTPKSFPPPSPPVQPPRPSMPQRSPTPPPSMPQKPPAPTAQPPPAATPQNPALKSNLIDLKQPPSPTSS